MIPSTHTVKYFHCFLSAILLVAIYSTVLPWGLLSDNDSQNISWELEKKAAEESESDTEENETLEGKHLKNLPQINDHIFARVDLRTALWLNSFNAYLSPVLDSLENPPQLQA